MGGFVDGALSQNLNPRILVADKKGAAAKFQDFRDRIGDDDDLAALAARVEIRTFLEAVADHSPFLWRIATHDPGGLKDILLNEPWAQTRRTLETLRLACRETSDDAVVMRALRQARGRMALLIALADLGGVWGLNDVTAALSESADAYVSVALDFLLRGAVADGKLIVDDHAPIQAQSGLTILALGKHGACELNYSSDVDLVVFYDADRAKFAPGVEPGPLYVRMTKALSRLLSERTGDGYVLRVDLRLRPDPGSTSVAISLPAALTYYETLGQNWERAAMIKARPIAGDRALGEYFITELRPFIWRRYFDYAAIADIHAMKRQIHAVRGHAEVVVEGHDVKLGRGGIREVEFFVQTQQLIFGGRRPELRGRRTLDMLNALEADGWVTKSARSELSAAYDVLRTIEHRIQMVADEQTQRLPNDAATLKRFAKFCGFSTYKKFETWLTRHLRAVERHYARLFEHAPGLDAEKGSLVFTGVSDDPDTLQTLSRLGFKDAPLAAETVRGWHFGRRAAVQTARAREVLTELVPELLESLSGSGDPDAALAAFDQTLNYLPAAIQLFSILKSNEKLRDLFGDVLGAAPRLAAIVAKRPNVLDAVIDPAFFGSALDRAFFDHHARRLARIEITEDFLDAARLMAQEDQFAIGIRVLSGAIDPVEAGPAFTALADSLLCTTLHHVERAFQGDHGGVPGGRIAVIAMGKMGSREMTAASDLDLVILYDFDPDHVESDGPRPLHAVQYYTRLTQRLISALTVSTSRGVLYDVDMRLRPSGRKGPIAVQFSTFKEYQATEAETWEHMALTRARAVCGDETLLRDATNTIREVLARPRDNAAVRVAIAEMRELIAKEKGDSDYNDLKIVRGGLIDIEFIAQYLVLAHGAEYKALMASGVDEILTRAAALQLVSPAELEALRNAYRLYTDVVQMQRAILPQSSKLDSAPPAALARIGNGAGLPDEKHLRQQIIETAANVSAIWRRMFAAENASAF